MNYGVNNATKVFCKKHQEFHPATEKCRWCAPCLTPLYPTLDCPYCLNTRKQANGLDSCICSKGHPGADADCYLCGGAGERWFVNGYGDHVCQTCSCVMVP